MSSQMSVWLCCPWLYPPGEFQKNRPALLPATHSFSFLSSCCESQAIVTVSRCHICQIGLKPSLSQEYTQIHCEEHIADQTNKKEISDVQRLKKKNPSQMLYSVLSLIKRHKITVFINFLILLGRLLESSPLELIVGVATLRTKQKVSVLPEVFVS